MEPICINLSVPFRVDGKSEEHPGCLKTFTSADIYAYVDALKKEIAVSSGDAQDCQVQEINFRNGSLTHMGMDIPKQLMKVLRSSFHVISDVKINITCTPAALDFFMLNAFRQLGNSFVTIEIPTLEEEGLKAAGYVTTRQDCLTALESCFQNAFHNYGVELHPKYFCSTEGLQETLMDILSRKPRQISFVTSPEGIYEAAISETLTGADYHKNEKTGVWQHGETPKQRGFRNQIGFGPYAISVVDGQAVRSTGDFDFYLAHSDDFEALIMHDAEA